jgi:hypothetical protein
LNIQNISEFKQGEIVRFTRIYLPASVPAAALTLLLISSLTGCNNTATPAPDASTQNAQDVSSASSNSSSTATPGTAAQASKAQKRSGSGGSATQARPVPVTLTVDAGKDINVRINETINSKTASVGDPFTGVLTTDLVTNDGRVVFPKGTNVSGAVVSSKGQGRFAGSGALAIDLKEVGGHPVTATEYVVSAKGKGKRSAALIGGGAGAGALIGGLAGGGKGALIGALAGGGAGTAGAAFTGNKQLVIPTESIVAFGLSQPLSITVMQ